MAVHLTEGQHRTVLGSICVLMLAVAALSAVLFRAGCLARRDHAELAGIIRECAATTNECLAVARDLSSSECRAGYLVCGPQGPDGSRPDCDTFEETWPVPCGPHDYPCKILVQGPVLYVERCLEAPYPPPPRTR